MPKILKSKFYIYRNVGNKTRLVLPEFGAFETDSKAFNFMFRPMPKDQQARPGCILMEKKPEFEDCYTVKGERIIKFPHIYTLERSFS